MTYYQTCVVFGPSPANKIIVRTGSQASTTTESVLGNYLPGELYRLDLSLDKEHGVFAGELTGGEPAPFSGPMLLLNGGRSSSAAYGDVLSTPIAVKPGQTYAFGGYVRVLDGADTYKLNVFWLDKQKRPLSFTNDWSKVDNLSGWTRLHFTGQAPTSAAYAVLHLASGDATQILFAQPFLSAELGGSNLVVNPDFSNQASGWQVADQPKRPLETLLPTTQSWVFSTTQADEPLLFAYFRHYLTVSAPSSGGTSTTAQMATAKTGMDT